MNPIPEEKTESIDLRNRELAAFLAWFFPGLGHIYQRRYFKGFLFGICVIGLYVTGLWLGKGLVVYWTWVNPTKDSENFRLSFIFQSFVGSFTLPGMVQGMLSYLNKPPTLGGWMAAPSQDVVNGLHPRIGRLVEIGTVYTAVAGLLNLLAIMDAYGGPVQIKQVDESEHPDQPSIADSSRGVA